MRHHLIGIVVAGFLAVVASVVRADSACDPAHGETVFKKCAACHSLEAGKHLTGPSLHGVVGRQAGMVDGFRFSPKLKSLGISWTTESLSEFLANPMKYAKGSRMAFSGLKDPAELRDVICYIAQSGS
jgi:cytochrome c